MPSSTSKMALGVFVGFSALFKVRSDVREKLDNTSAITKMMKGNNNTSIH
jgi:hypothetical protein